MTALLRSGRFRGLVYQATLVVTVCAVLIMLVVNTRQNLVAQGIASGFDFLERSTGWNVSFALMDYAIRDPYWRVLLVGFENTIFVGLLSLVFATVLGTLIGIARVGRNPLLSLLGTVHVEIFRNVPLILQGLFWYAVLTHLPPPRQAIALWDAIYLSSRGIYVPFVALSHGTFLAVVATILIAAAAIYLAPRVPRVRFRTTRRGVVIAAVAISLAVIVGNHDPQVGLFTTPRLLGLRFEGGLRLTPEFAALFIAIVGFGSAYIAEIVRGGLLSVNQGQLEAARALGLSPFRVTWHVRIPLALRSVVPPLGNQFIWLMKATTVGIAFGFSDLFMVSSTAINQSGQTIEILFLMMAGFLLINYVIASIMNALNRSIALKGFGTKRG
ncbi:MAG: ABC transporter permease subunit [Proteobacteria bacterium]|nr:ABC transporter permease subunit [Pseudomonadota bacterium]